MINTPAPATANALQRGARRAMTPFVEFTRTEAAGGVLLLACALLALAWVNSPWDGAYDRLWATTISLSAGDRALSKTLLQWINDGLMAVFFFVVGLEIKREALAGELASARRAALPIVAALGGMAVPALLYAALNAGGPGARGWGVPMATDIAFALGILALLGNRVPVALKVFLTAVAIVDDIGAVLVIAFFYTASLSLTALAWAAIFLLGLVVLNRAGARAPHLYIALGVLLWVAVLRSGVHATIAGVLLALTIPAHGLGDDTEQSPVEQLEHALHPWVAFAIMPLFALANAGVRIDSGVASALTDRVALGVVVGLVVGKQVGVLLASWLAVRAGLADLPEDVNWRQLHGASFLAGIGFTMSLFIGSLAFADAARLSAAKLGILLASLISGVFGFMLLRAQSRRAAPE